MHTLPLVEDVEPDYEGFLQVSDQAGLEVPILIPNSVEKPTTLLEFVPPFEATDDLSDDGAAFMGPDHAPAHSEELSGLPAYAQFASPTRLSPPPASALGLVRETSTSDSPLRMPLSPPTAMHETLLPSLSPHTHKVDPLDEYLSWQTPRVSATSVTGLYMRARPLLWGADDDILLDSRIPFAQPTATRRSNRQMSDSYYSIENGSGLRAETQVPPWRQPLVAQTAFRDYATAARDAQALYATAESLVDPNPTQQHYAHVLNYPYPSFTTHHQTVYTPENVHMDPPPSYAPLPSDSPPATFAMPGSYRPSTVTDSPPPRYVPYPQSQSQQCYAMQPRNCASCPVHAIQCTPYGCTPGNLPSPPASPCRSGLGIHSSCSSATSARDSAMSTNFGHGLAAHTPSHAFVSLPSANCASHEHLTCRSTPPASPGVVNISISFPPACHAAVRHEWLYRRVWSLCTLLLPFVFALPLGLLLFNATAFSLQTSSCEPFHAPLFWRALSSLLSYVVRVLRDTNVKM